VTFFARRYKILLFIVSCMTSDMRNIGAAMNRITHCVNRQLLLYWSMMYAPMSGPSAGPRKGAITKDRAARPACLRSQMSEIVPVTVRDANRDEATSTYQHQLPVPPNHQFQRGDASQ